MARFMKISICFLFGSFLLFFIIDGLFVDNIYGGVFHVITNRPEAEWVSSAVIVFFKYFLLVFFFISVYGFLYKKTFYYAVACCFLLVYKWYVIRCVYVYVFGVYADILLVLGVVLVLASSVFVTWFWRNLTAIRCANPDG